MGEARRRRLARLREDAERRLAESLDDPSTTGAEDLAIYAGEVGKVTSSVKVRLPGMRGMTTISATGDTRDAARKNAEQAATEMAAVFQRVAGRVLAEMPVAGSA